MILRARIRSLRKRHPLTISRGTSSGSDNIFVEVEHAGITGIGEMSPVNIGGPAEEASGALDQFPIWADALRGLEPWQMQRVESALDSLGGGRAARAALDFALHDWLGKRAGLPVYAILGGDLDRIPPTSLTVGINAPDVARERSRELLQEFAPRAIKVKLGSPSGVAADREMFQAVREAVPPDVAVRVDANGGWTARDAREMIAWLAERGVEYVEQPLPRGSEGDLPVVHRGSPLPIFVDESCCVAGDVPPLAECIDGVNLKLMKAGGIREGLRVIHTLRAHGLQVMMGCYSESSLAISASAHLSMFADYLDLDSHLNLDPDPCRGLEWKDGRVLPGSAPGLGIEVDD